MKLRGRAKIRTDRRAETGTKTGKHGNRHLPSFNHLNIPGIIFILATLFLLPPPSPQAATHRYALSLFHFNIQYVAGGLIGLFPKPCPLWDLSAEEVEDSIVVESFEPILDLFLEHPQWGTDLEMQAYFLEVLEERHPQVLEKLQTLSLSGQVDVVSFHYADQLFLAYPRTDLERSLQRTHEVFAAYGIPLSRSVFCQEGQASPAMPPVMEEWGYEYMVWPKNLYRYQHGKPDPVMPFYEFGNLWMVLGPESVDYTFEEEEIQVQWTFLDDGELLATNDWDPYFPPFFRHDPAAVTEYEEKLIALENQGYKITTVGGYMDELLDMNIPASDPGPLLEGTWQPDSTNGIFRWMGGSGLFAHKERDNYVRTLCAVGHRELLAAETMALARKSKGRSEKAFSEAVREGWRLLSLAQVSDATGINPFRGEVDYGIAHASEALRIARDLIEQGKKDLGYPWVVIDTLSKEVLPGKAPALQENPVLEDPITVRIEAEGRETSKIWKQVGHDPTVYRLDLNFSPGLGHTSRTLRATFPGDPDRIIYCPSLQEETPVERNRQDFVWEHFVLPLPNGLIYLEGNRALVKDTAMVHVGAFVYADRPDICFEDKTAPEKKPVTWTFYLLEAERDEAVSFANRLNIWPTLYR